MTELDRTALVVVDVQRAFDDAGYWGPRNNAACEANVAALIAAASRAARCVAAVTRRTGLTLAAVTDARRGRARK